MGRALKGPVNDSRMIHSFTEYERIFGGIWSPSNMSYAVYQYFQNGGRDAIIVRVHRGATTSTIDITDNPDSPTTTILTLRAANPGMWSSKLEVNVVIQAEADIKEIADADKAIDPQGVNTLFDLIVKDGDRNILETFRNLSLKKSSPKYIVRILREGSDMLRAENVADPPPNHPDPAPTPTPPFPHTYTYHVNTAGSDGDILTDTEIIGGAGPPKEGINALDGADLFNMLCIPPYDASKTTPSTVYSAALSYFEQSQRRAMLLIDPPDNWNNATHPLDPAIGVDNVFGTLRNKNAAIFFPRFTAPDPELGNRTREFVPCGIVAGLIARVDSERGVWKSPAGIETTLNGVLDLTIRLTDQENGDLNPLGINCLRVMPPAGIVVWGARTMRGADRLADQWKYLAVRRTALYIEESLYRGIHWVVFEPNDEPLWAQIRLNVGAFMHNLFRQGAFQGSSPKEAYFVKCDKETTTQYDIDRGIVNIIVGFAPLKPAEFVILQIQQITRGAE
jgi:hypothetical protein